MKLIKPFDPTVGTTGIIETLGINKGEQLVLFNDSLVGLALNFNDGSQDVLPASWARDYIIKNSPMGQITWKLYNTVSLINYPISSVYGAIYEPGEHIPAVNSPIPRAFNIGNSTTIPTTGGGSSGVATSVVNDGNGLNSPIVEVTPLSAASSTIQIDNIGNVLIREYVASVLTTVLQIIAGGAGPHIKLGNGGAIKREVEVEHNLNVVGQLTASGNSTLANNIFDSIAGITSASHINTSITGPVGNFNCFGTADVYSALVAHSAAQVIGILAAAGIVNVGDISTDTLTANTNGGGTGRVKTDAAGALLVQLPGGTDAIRLEVDGSITAMGTKLAGFGSKGVKRSLVDDTGTIVYHKASTGWILQVPNGTSMVEVSTTYNHAPITGQASTMSLAGDLKLGTNNSGLSTNLFYGDGSKQGSTHIGTGTVTGTYSHGCNKAPQWIGISISSVGSATTGYDTVTATQFHATIAAVNNFTFEAHTYN